MLRHRHGRSAAWRGVLRRRGGRGARGRGGGAVARVVQEAETEGRHEEQKDERVDREHRGDHEVDVQLAGRALRGARHAVRWGGQQRRALRAAPRAVDAQDAEEEEH